MCIRDRHYTDINPKEYYGNETDKPHFEETGYFELHKAYTCLLYTSANSTDHPDATKDLSFILDPAKQRQNAGQLTVGGSQTINIRCV